MCNGPSRRILMPDQGKVCISAGVFFFFFLFFCCILLPSAAVLGLHLVLLITWDLLALCCSCLEEQEWFVLKSDERFEIKIIQLFWINNAVFSLVATACCCSATPDGGECIVKGGTKSASTHCLSRSPVARLRDPRFPSRSWPIGK